MLGRTRASRTAANDPGVPVRVVRSSAPEAGLALTSGDPGGDPDAGPPPRRTASETLAVNVNTAASDSDSHSILSTASSGYRFVDPSEQGRFKAKDLGPFCEQLDRLLDYIHSTADLNHVMYTYPSKLQELLDTQALELRAIHREARAAHVRIQQVKNQRKAVRKECRAMDKSLAAIKEEEIKEMENYIALYDKALITRWEKIRSSSQEDVVDSFIHDIKGKQKALEYLHTLSSNKLKQLQNSHNSTEESKPVSLALRRLSASSGGRSNTGRWRNKHHERAIRSPAANVPQEANPPLPPPINLTLVPALNGNEGTIRLSSTSVLGSASSSFLQTNPPAVINTHLSSNSSSPLTISSPERRSILQALFSDIQHPGTHDNLPINAVMPRLVNTASAGAARLRGRGGTDNQNANVSGNSENGNDIELYNLNDAP
ncbi:uncharacterized protein LOC117652807 [Thrips palmi]|uniref:Uncharacterized protein LOC117652807 n=1 Tax=Thrips palmi TaxID=161013 RepID=A0A6P9ADA9_THRPL|nr:uncharacterized protein LOC117652807 [Thrips palmi]